MTCTKKVGVPPWLQGELYYSMKVGYEGIKQIFETAKSQGSSEHMKEHSINVFYNPLQL